MKIIITIVLSFILSYWLFTLNLQLIQLDISEIKYLKFGVSKIDRLLLIFASMTLGIFFKSIYNYVGNPSKHKLKNETKGLVRVVLISPIIFFGVYLLTQNQPDDLISLILSFQNGFFWRSMLK